MLIPSEVKQLAHKGENEGRITKQQGSKAGVTACFANAGKAEAKSGEQLLMAAYGLTSKPIENALLMAHTRGAKVRLLVDAKSNRNSAMARRLEEAGILIRFDDRYSPPY